jgi:hypothetical protein
MVARATGRELAAVNRDDCTEGILASFHSGSETDAKRKTLV